MIDLRQFEEKQIKDLLHLFDYIFSNHPSTEEVREILNLLNLSMRRLIEILESTTDTKRIDEQIKILTNQLNDYVDHSSQGQKYSQIPKFVHDFLDLVTAYYKFVEKDIESILDLCNVFRIISEVYLRIDRKDESLKNDIRHGLNELIDDWLSGKVKPPSSHEEIEDMQHTDSVESQNPWGIYETIVLESHLAGICWITLNRPDRRNAMNQTMIEELEKSLRVCEKDPAVRVVVIRGSGNVFCAGADLQDMLRSSGTNDQGSKVFSNAFGHMLQSLNEYPKVVVISVNGASAGGALGLICCGDVVLAADNASFSFPEVQLGMIPAMISSFVVERIGVAQSRRLMLSAETIKAQEAVSLGIVNEVVKADELANRTEQVAKRFLNNSPAAISECKQLIRYVARHTVEENLNYASKAFVKMLASDDAKEGLRSFNEKRKPHWTPK